MPKGSDAMKFEVLGEPIPLARARFGRGRAYLPKRSREYRCRLAEAAVEALSGHEPLTGELSCRIEIYRKYKRTARTYGDVDNHIKAALDGMQGIIFADDKQVVEISAVKHTDKARPRLVVEVNQLSP